MRKMTMTIDQIRKKRRRNVLVASSSTKRKSMTKWMKMKSGKMVPMKLALLMKLMNWDQQQEKLKFDAEATYGSKFILIKMTNDMVYVTNAKPFSLLSVRKRKMKLKNI